MTEVLSERELRALMGVIEEARHGEPTEGMPWALWDGLAPLVRCDAMSFSESDLADDHDLVLQWAEGDDRNMDLGGPQPAVFWKSLKEFLPCDYPRRTGDYASVVRWSDFHTTAQQRSIPLLALFYRQDGFYHGMHATFPTLPGQMRKISFWRGAGLDFSERDRLVVELLRPHLWEIYLDGQRRRHRVPQLTRREWEVLQLADQGLGNTAIAQQLFVSVATVRKHMEHIFDRTGARTRTAAAALMMPHHNGIAPGPQRVSRRAG